MNKPLNKRPLLNTLTLALALGLSAGAVPIFAEEMDKAMNTDTPTDVPTSANTDMPTSAATYTNNWKTPEAIAFDKLDTTGNGLLLPNEAAKGKAFNKKTFATADADKDGYIDVNEYVYHKTGKWPESAQPVNTGATNNNVGGNALVSEEPVTMAETQTTANNEASDDVNKRTVGVVIDDSVITTKAKAKILATKDLKSLQISVETRQGEITLSGTVDNEAAKMKAEQVVSEIEGVKSVKNGLEVKS